MINCLVLPDRIESILQVNRARLILRRRDGRAVECGGLENR